MDYRYTAIVLKKREVGETDRLYTFYTREAGKIQSMAKGVRRAEAKLASTLETLSLVDLMVVRSRGMGKVAGAVLEKSFSQWRLSYESLASATEALASFDSLVDLEEPDQALFTLLLSYLEAGEKLIVQHRITKIPLLSEAFHFQLLSHLGYRLELGSCVMSGRRPKPGDRLALSPSAGGLVLGESVRELSDCSLISENVVKLLRLFASHPLTKLDRLVVPDRELMDITRFRRALSRWVRR